jgi:signal transduction histidine kinase
MLRKRLFSNFLLIILFSIFITACAFILNGYSHLVVENERSLISRTQILADSFCRLDLSSVEEMNEYLREQSDQFNLRLTLINQEGKVVADSQVDLANTDQMGNHKNRPEVQTALEKQVGVDHRRSESTGVEYYYAAVQLKTDLFDGVLRASEPAKAFRALRNRLLVSILLLSFLGVGIAVILMYYFTRKITAPIEKMTRQAEQISEGNYEGQIEVLDKDEVGRLILSFNQMTKNLKAEKEQVEKLENMRRDFVSNVTHELKTPLTSIRGFVETLKEGAIEDEEVAMRFLSIIDIEAERLGNLIEDILLLSEIESGTDTRMSLVEVEPMIDQVIELLNQSKKENVILKKESKGHVAPFYCNEDRLRELIINLADNGVKYTNEGSVTIECRQEENMLVLEFSDTGVGIPKEHLPRLFERFYRVDKGRSRKQGGTGLGLSIVKHIVELYKGTISVESEPGVGSTFTVRLPYDERS